MMFLHGIPLIKEGKHDISAERTNKTVTADRRGRGRQIAIACNVAPMEKESEKRFEKQIIDLLAKAVCEQMSQKGNSNGIPRT